MKKVTLTTIVHLFLVLLAFTGCRRPSDEVWDDTKTAGRHMSRGVKSLFGSSGDSRQVYCREDFFHCDDDDFCYEEPYALEFEPIPDQHYSNEIAMADNITRNTSSPQPHHEPGQPNSHIPGIEAFKDPKNDSTLSSTFQTVHFPYNSSLIKGKDNMDIVRGIADYLKTHPDTYLFVEGHCDERGAEAYNLALGARRSNSMRNLLIKNGVSPENIFSVSYGKERPIDLGHSENSWANNRRAEFKIFKG